MRNTNFCWFESRDAELQKLRVSAVSRTALKVKKLIYLLFKIMLKTNSLEMTVSSVIGTKFKLLDIILESIFKNNAKIPFVSEIFKKNYFSVYFYVEFYC